MDRKTPCWLQITSGRGPVECQLGAMKLAHKIVAEAEKGGLEAELIEVQEGDKKGTALSALVSLGGEAVAGFAESWVGTVLWICPSPYRKGHKRKNWFVGVEILQGVNDVSMDVDLRDIQFESLRATGPGGQHVNTTESAVRALHRPSGISVLAREERSQHMNKKLAVARIVSKLKEQNERAKGAAKQAQWEQHNQLERGDPVRVFRGERFLG